MLGPAIKGVTIRGGEEARVLIPPPHRASVGFADLGPPSSPGVFFTGIPGIPGTVPGTRNHEHEDDRRSTCGFWSNNQVNLVA